MRLLVFDGGSSPAWSRDPVAGISLRIGSVLAWARCHFDAVRGTDNWGDALAWIYYCARFRTVREIQIWAHGSWGEVHLGESILNARCFQPMHLLAPVFKRIRADLSVDTLFWFRSC